MTFVVQRVVRPAQNSLPASGPYYAAAQAHLMSNPSPVYCETAELVVEVSAIARRLGLSIAPELSADPLDAAAHAAKTGAFACALCLRMPEANALVLALDVCSASGRLVLAALSEVSSPLRGLAGDLGMVCVDDVAPALAALALLRAGQPAARAHARRLSSSDRARLGEVLQERAGAKLASMGDGEVGVERREGEEALLLGGARSVGQALSALRSAHSEPGTPLESDPRARTEAREVLFGPPRLLSDPASKLALTPFGLPLPQEELCSSPSRAASEAGRIGFPVRISLASPDLRVWDHPDLSVDGVDNAARVRDVYRQLTTLAEERAKGARVLGVTVAATTLAQALVRISMRKLPGTRVLLRVGFADPHGAVSKDVIVTALPASDPQLERALARLLGHALIVGERGPEREENLRAFSDLCVRAARFVDAFRSEVSRVELHPVALLVGGGAEVREAAVEVTDAFVRELG
jgi:hypothetical protein